MIEDAAAEITPGISLINRWGKQYIRMYDAPEDLSKHHDSLATQEPVTTKRILTDETSFSNALVPN